MKDFYFWRIEATEEYKKKFGDSGILVLEGKRWTDQLGNVVKEERYHVRGEHTTSIKEKEVKNLLKKYNIKVDLKLEYIDRKNFMMILEPHYYEIFTDNINEMLNNEIIPNAIITGNKDFDFEKWGIRIYGKVTFTKKEHQGIIKRFFNL